MKCLKYMTLYFPFYRQSKLANLKISSSCVNAPVVVSRATSVMCICLQLCRQEGRKSKYMADHSLGKKFYYCISLHFGLLLNSTTHYVSMKYKE